MTGVFPQEGGQDPVQIVHRALVEGGEDSGIAFVEASMALKVLHEAGWRIVRLETSTLDQRGDLYRITEEWTP